MSAPIRIAVLHNAIKNYAWGSKTHIPELLGMEPDGQPQAELWMGAHPSSPSMVVTDNAEASLLDLITQDPAAVLGRSTAEKFQNRLPFLFKVLAAGNPLSIQAHPSLDQAKRGFRRDNEQGISLEAFSRSYKDDNHKPEVICALTPFWALRGFRSMKAMLALFDQFDLAEIRAELGGLRAGANREGLKAFYTKLMSMPDERKKRVVSQVVAYAQERESDDPVCQWVSKLNTMYPGDMGVISPIMLNLVKLEPGQALYLAAGELHAYLNGLGIELMANSDNVLRGGCTPKFVNVPELLEVLTFSTGDAPLVMPRAVSPCEKVFPTPTSEFQLSLIEVSAAQPYQKEANDGIEILICTNGNAAVKDEETSGAIEVRKGVSIVVSAAVARYAIAGAATLYKASVPQHP